MGGNFEAKSWLESNKNSSALATNRFGDTKSALEFVNILYAVGAERVEVEDVYDEEPRVQEEGGPYADTLSVTLPTDPEKRIKLFEMFNKESVNQGFDEHKDEGQSEVTLWWD